MNEEISFILEEAEESMQNAFEHLEREFQKIRAGKANPAMLDGVRVDYYGTMSPLDQIANINTPDPRQIIVQPWEKVCFLPSKKPLWQPTWGLILKITGKYCV